MSKTLIISGHTDLNDSVANKTILDIIGGKLPDVQIRKLDSLYPDFKIDADTEQKALVEADVIVFQFPVFWYSMPSLLERWMEETFKHGFSHGSTGDKLHGKKLIISMTTGAPEEMYHKDAAVGYEIEDFIVPILASCNLCGIEYAGLVYTGGVSYTMRQEPGKLEELKSKAENHAARLEEMIKGL